MVQAHPVRSAKLHSAPSHNYFAILTARDKILQRIVCSFYSPLNRTLLTVIAFYALFRAFGLPRGPHAAQVHYFDTSISKYLFCPRYFSRLSQLTLSDLPFQLCQSIISYCLQKPEVPAHTYTQHANRAQQFERISSPLPDARITHPFRHNFSLCI